MTESFMDGCRKKQSEMWYPSADLQEYMYGAEAVKVPRLMYA